MVFRPQTGSSANKVQEYDVVVVGAGFSGIANLYRLRKAGFTVHVFESASDFGGVWHWNRYPGVRVDSEVPFYQFNIPEVYNTFTFQQRFPNGPDLRRYLTHCDKVLELRKDVSFDSRVNHAEWDAKNSSWSIGIASGEKVRSKYLILATGALHRKYVPDYEGIDDFKGILTHSVDWDESTSVAGKKVAVIGGGATSVQLVQEFAKKASGLAVFVRNPSYAVPMRQKNMTEQEQGAFKVYYDALFKAGRKSWSGFPIKPYNQRAQHLTPDERERHLEEIWESGGFQFYLRLFSDVIIDKESNRIVYDFWKRKVRERLTNPQKAAIMAPDTPPFYVGTRRGPLEHDYYEMLDQSNVSIIDLKATEIERFTSTGIQVSGSIHEFDIVVLATGFDSFTGSITRLGLKNKEGTDIADVWKDGVRTYLGITMHGFPNAFQLYSPHAPSVLSNAFTTIEAQADFICDALAKLRKEGAKSIEPTAAAEDEWKKGIDDITNLTLYPYTKSWWNTGNIPGKKAENINYLGGVDTYERQCRATLDDWIGFEIVAGEGPKL